MPLPSLLRRSARASARNRLPQMVPGLRVYAIGDVHGCIDELDRLLAMIEADDAARGPADRCIVFLGDLVDRGPASAAVVERVAALVAKGAARLIKGNHEELFVEAVRGDALMARTLLENGGLATLGSYGISEEEAMHGSFADLSALLQQRLPTDAIGFLDRGEDMIALGDYLFVHAGIYPGVPLSEQQPRHLRWIRDPFLDSRASHGVVVVHGHTITRAVVERENRIGIDTGAFATGVLTAIGLEGRDRWFLATTPGPGR